MMNALAGYIHQRTLEKEKSNSEDKILKEHQKDPSAKFKINPSKRQVKQKQ